MSAVNGRENKPSGHRRKEKPEVLEEWPTNELKEKCVLFKQLLAEREEYQVAGTEPFPVDVENSLLKQHKHHNQLTNQKMRQKYPFLYRLMAKPFADEEEPPLYSNIRSFERNSDPLVGGMPAGAIHEAGPLLEVTNAPMGCPVCHVVELNRFALVRHIMTNHPHVR